VRIPHPRFDPIFSYRILSLECT